MARGTEKKAIVVDDEDHEFLLHGLEGLREQRRRKSTRGSETEAPQGYLDFVASELKLKEQPTLLGGGMLRSRGGMGGSAFKAAAEQAAVQRRADSWEQRFCGGGSNGIRVDGSSPGKRCRF